MKPAIFPLLLVRLTAALISDYYRTWSELRNLIFFAPMYQEFSARTARRDWDGTSPTNLAASLRTDEGGNWISSLLFRLDFFFFFLPPWSLQYFCNSRQGSQGMTGRHQSATHAHVGCRGRSYSRFGFIYTNEESGIAVVTSPGKAVPSLKPIVIF